MADKTLPDRKRFLLMDIKVRKKKNMSCNYRIRVFSFIPFPAILYRYRKTVQVVEGGKSYGFHYVTGSRTCDRIFCVSDDRQQ